MQALEYVSLYTLEAPELPVVLHVSSEASLVSFSEYHGVRQTDNELRHA